MHPLIRGFVLRKAPPDAAELEPLFDQLINDGEWDGAFRLAERGLQNRMDDLIRAALPDLLARSHIQTLEKWVRFAEDAKPGPAAELVRAEVAFREGQFFEAKALAKTVAQALDDNDELKIRALLILGRAAHLASEEEESLEAYRAARTLARPCDQHV